MSAAPNVMADVLASITNVHKVVASATFYRARLGRRRAFMSASDAEAYDRGYSEYPALPDNLGTPQAQGYVDAQADHHDELDRRNEVAT